MTDQEVYFVDWQEVTLIHHKEHKNVFAYRYQPGWYGWERRGLQKLCFWILRKIGAFYVEPVKETAVTYYRIDGRSFMDKIINQMHVLDGFWEMRPKRLLIGLGDYRKLMFSDEAFSGPEGKPWERFQFQGEYWARNKSGHPEICGLTVDVIPWMKGILVMPE